MALSVDPALGLLARLALALLFASAARHKLRDPLAFQGALAGYRLAPDALVPWLAWVVSLAELAIALALPVARAAALPAALLLGSYTAAISVNLARGRRDIDCGCAGPAERRPLSGALVLRNLALIALAGVAALEPGARPLVWVDALTIAAGVAVAALGWAALDGLLAQAPRSRALGGA